MGPNKESFIFFHFFSFYNTPFGFSSGNTYLGAFKYRKLLERQEKV
jgi:hypothetical protein